MFERSSNSQERDVTDNLRSKRTASAQGLNVSTEGKTMFQGCYKVTIQADTDECSQKIYVYDINLNSAPNIVTTSGVFVHHKQ